MGNVMCNVMPYYAILCNLMQYHAILCLLMHCYAMLCNVIYIYILLFNVICTGATLYVIPCVIVFNVMDISFNLLYLPNLQKLPETFLILGVISDLFALLTIYNLLLI